MDKQVLFVFVIQTLKQEWNTSIHTTQNILVTFWWVWAGFFGPHAIMGEKTTNDFQLKETKCVIKLIQSFIAIQI